MHRSAHRPPTGQVEHALHYVDPYAKRGVIYRAYVQFGRTRMGRGYGLRFGSRIDPWLYRVTGGRYPSILGSIASAPLVAVGARTGEPREVQRTYFHDGPDPILIASNGGARHPNWYHNLLACPQCEFGDRPYVATEVTDPEEYDRLYVLAERVFAGYRDYRTTTAALGRRIPVFRLTATDG